MAFRVSVHANDPELTSILKSVHEARSCVGWRSKSSLSLMMPWQFIPSDAVSSTRSSSSQSHYPRTDPAPTHFRSHWAHIVSVPLLGDPFHSLGQELIRKASKYHENLWNNLETPLKWIYFGNHRNRSKTMTLSWRGMATNPKPWMITKTLFWKLKMFYWSMG